MSHTWWHMLEHMLIPLMPERAQSNLAEGSYVVFRYIDLPQWATACFWFTHGIIVVLQWVTVSGMGCRRQSLWHSWDRVHLCSVCVHVCAHSYLLCHVDPVPSFFLPLLWNRAISSNALCCQSVALGSLGLLFYFSFILFFKSYFYVL